MNLNANLSKAKGVPVSENHTPDSNKRLEIVDEDDPVVHEIPVFLAQSLANELFLFQVKYNINLSKILTLYHYMY